MATLVSAGVDISVVDESFRSSAGDGTVPLILIATAENKTTPGQQADDNGGIAPGTLATNAGKLYLITSQRELVQTFGDPIFQNIQGTPLHADERNEYGLLTAYSYLGISNRAYVIRADVDLSELTATASEPTGDPEDGTYWFDFTSSKFGVFLSNGEGNSVEYNDWDLATVNVIDSSAESEGRLIGDLTGTTPGASGTVTPGGNLVINSTTIAIANNASLDDVVDAITSAAISNISASIWYTSKGANLKIKHATGGTIALTGSTSTVVSDLGLSSAPSTTAQVDHPNTSVGDESEYAIVVLDTQNRIYQKLVAQDSDGVAITGAGEEWYLVGSDSWREAMPTLAVGDEASPTFAGSEVFNIRLSFNGDTTVDTTILAETGDTVADIRAKVIADSILSTYVTSGQLVVSVNGNGYLRIENRDGGEITTSGSAAIILGTGQVKARTLTYATHTSIPVGSRAGDTWIKTTEPNSGADWVIKLYDAATGQFSIVDAPMYATDSAATAAITPTAAGVLYIQYNASGNDTALHTIKRWTGTAWAALTYEASAAEPTTEAEEGTLWYDATFAADIMVSTGSTWVGLNNHPNYTTSEIIYSASRPTTKPSTSPVSAGGALANNDLWIDTSDTENYPRIYRYNSTTRKFTLIDNTDQTTPFGIVFADARWHDGSTSQLQTQAAFNDSDFVDPDAPNPLLYPNGMLLFNTRFSTQNVKEWNPEYLSEYTEDELLPDTTYSVGTATYSPIADTDVGRWVTTSGNQNNGAMFGGRKAQRAVIVRAMQASLAGNEDIRAETIFFNLIASPGYPELIDEMITLNVDKKQFAFIIGDTPARLAPSGTAIQNWATNATNQATNNEDGLTAADTYVGLYYPWGLTTNTDGFDVMVPPSHIALRTIANNDNVAFPWFAPAGFNRGVVSNATSVGYLTSEGEYQAVTLNQGQRDTLQTNKINPIAFMPGQGLVVFGQKTLHPISSALDRVNVVRLINFLRRQFNQLSQPFLFEPNDEQTRDSIRVTFERAMQDLITLRALEDFAVVCDTSNNTPARINRYELWVDVAIIPTKAVEFIYIPIRVLNTGEDLPS